MKLVCSLLMLTFLNTIGPPVPRGCMLPRPLFAGLSHVTVPQYGMRKTFLKRCHQSAHSEKEIRGNKRLALKGRSRERPSWPIRAMLAFCCGRPAKSYG
jgi:hypothetical protein